MGRGRTSEPAWQERLPDPQTRDLWATLVRGGASSTLLTVVDDGAEACPPSCKILTRISRQKAQTVGVAVISTPPRLRGRS